MMKHKLIWASQLAVRKRYQFILLKHPNGDQKDNQPK